MRNNQNKSFFIKLLLMLVPVVTSAQTKNISDPIRLWPNGAPGEMANPPAEKDNTKPTDNKPDGRAVIRLTNVSDPTITVYTPAKTNNGAAMIVCPGGGYSILAMDLEGTEICEWLNSIGVTAILLKYRVPAKKDLPRYQPPLQDAQRAMGWVRYNAKKFGIDTGKIGIMGFSAGGHLSATLSTNYSKRTYDVFDEADKTNCRPDFVALIYPAYLTVKDKGDEIAAELPVNSNTPPTLLIQTEDDPVRVESSVYYYLALKKEKVAAEMHLYAKGGHGYGMRAKGTGIETWPERMKEWLQTNQIIK
ncbi:MAG: Xylanase [Sediminibacterium sp.]|nr:Xylanase [Sediminibacterium sp.]